MSNKPVTGVLLDTETNTVRKATLDGTLIDIYKNLHCRCFDICNREIGGKRFDVYCDDEGLFHEHPIVTALTPNGEPMLVGNLFICLHDIEGDTVSLTDQDVRLILNAVHGVLTQDLQFRPVLIMDY